MSAMLRIALSDRFVPILIHILVMRADSHHILLQLVKGDVSLEAFGNDDSMPDLFSAGTDVLPDEPETSNVMKKKAPDATISFQKYSKIGTMLLHHVHQHEEREAAKALDTQDDSPTGITRHDLVSWYCEELSDELETEEDINAAISLVWKIVDRLIKKEKFLVERSVRQIVQDDEGEQEEEVKYLFIHPNISIDNVVFESV
ncbi:hypothetical protein SARC_05441 [Sphaeroforma arctica JP610]|uniref:Mcm6 C-terminal winged-helix domain-containing protein n=1 Tax=Sphaeroforma arctica JP610 TaxID=667725 RepID=A0A0L0G091_9EUKA|nr:hypothetical protein SARC_05441 [Sphaeroforma arctica JP610]KNC82269.1 hypothetical protein SARC_05441 [Sphaeroforma arctica JP610]|eukprot:XP_014156171.1 hypothetical protein SARC_05441 [Sphaeroforma arctica JP610]